MDQITIFIITALVVMSICSLCYSWGYKDGRKPGGLPKFSAPPPPPEKWTPIQSYFPSSISDRAHFSNPLFKNVWQFNNCKQCELCERKVSEHDRDCDHIKNGYCQIFLNQARADIKKIKSQPPTDHSIKY